jgi:hypothetical protein
MASDRRNQFATGGEAQTYGYLPAKEELSMSTKSGALAEGGTT